MESCNPSTHKATILNDQSFQLQSNAYLIKTHDTYLGVKKCSSRLHQYRLTTLVIQQRAACGGCLRKNLSRSAAPHSGKPRHYWPNSSQCTVQEVDNH
eukprot:14139853-Ditylum_brightwellii.AAC.1